MNKVVRALKLYFKAAAHPFVIGFGLFMMIGMSLAFIIDPEPVGSEDYLTMLGVIQMGNMGTVIMVIAANTKLQQNKFYGSCTCAKKLFTIGPVAAVTVLNMIYDTVLAVSAYSNLGTVGLADTIVFNTISSMLMIILGGCFGKTGVPFVAVLQYVAYIAFLSFPFSVKILPNMNKLLGIPVTTAVIIAVCGYVLAIVSTLLIENIWWKKGDKFAAQYNAALNALELQVNGS